MRMLRYKHRQIGSIESLARCLGISVKVIEQTANDSGNFYLPNKPIEKPSGKPRQTYTVREPLKEIQERILQRILNNVEFPQYLQGAIRDEESPRDYIHDAELHQSSVSVTKFDIASFFSSTSSELVYRMWKNLLNFPDEVAEILTKLTTLKGFIPEGAPTSAAVANMIFFNREPDLELEFRKQGYIYSRYIDDITVSSTIHISKAVQKEITSKIYGMLLQSGLKPNRRKRKFLTRKGPLGIHGLNINAGKPTIPTKERARIRAAVIDIEIQASTANSFSDIKDEFEQVMGRVALLNRLHPKQGAKYLERLKNVQKKFEHVNE